METCIRMREGKQRHAIYTEDLYYYPSYGMAVMNYGTPAFAGSTVRTAADLFGSSMACKSLLCAGGTLGEIEVAHAVANNISSNGVRMGSDKRVPPRK